MKKNKAPKKEDTYKSRVEERIRHFYLMLMLVGSFLGFCYFILVPYVGDVMRARRVHPEKGVEVAAHAAEDVPVPAQAVAVERSKESAAMEELNSKLLLSLEEAEALRERLAGAEARTAEVSGRLQDAVSTLQDAAARLEAMKALEARLADMDEQNRDLLAQVQSLTEERDGLEARVWALEQELQDARADAVSGAGADVEDEEARLKQALLDLHERMQAKHGDAQLLDSVAMAQWRLLRYDTEWVLRTLSRVTPENSAELVPQCTERLREALFVE